MLEKISELKENYHIRLLDEWFIIQDLFYYFIEKYDYLIE